MSEKPTDKDSEQDVLDVETTGNEIEEPQTLASTVEEPYSIFDKKQKVLVITLATIASSCKG